MQSARCCCCCCCSNNCWVISPSWTNDGKCWRRWTANTGARWSSSRRRWGEFLPTPRARKRAFLLCGNLDFESAQNDTNSRAVFIARIHAVKRRNLAKKLNNQPRYFQIRSLNAFGQHTLCTRKMELALEVKFRLDFHWVTRPWRRTLTYGSDFKYIPPAFLPTGRRDRALFVVGCFGQSLESHNSIVMYASPLCCSCRLFFLGCRIPSPRAFFHIRFPQKRSEEKRPSSLVRLLINAVTLPSNPSLVKRPFVSVVELQNVFTMHLLLVPAAPSQKWSREQRRYHSRVSFSWYSSTDGRSVSIS